VPVALIYEGLIDAEKGQFLRRDAQLYASSDARLLLDQAQLVERLEHLVGDCSPTPVAG